MESLICSTFSHPSTCCSVARISAFASRPNNKNHNHKKLQLPKNLRHRRRTEPPPDFYPHLHPVKDPAPCEEPSFDSEDSNEEGNVVWESDEIEAITSLFQGRIPQKPGKLSRQRPLPLPLPHKTRPLGLPTSKKLIRTHLVRSTRQPVSNQLYKNPAFLISLAKEIKSLPDEENVATVLNQWARFLRKGSLSLTVRELGHMGLPRRALHVFSWVQNQPHLFPDDRILASAVEVLARAHELKMPFDLDQFASLTSRSVYEAMVKGSIKGGNLKLASKLLAIASESKRTLDVSVYVKLILQLAKNPDKRILVSPLLDELAERENLELTPMDCTAVMKACTRLGKFDVVESLYDWFKHTGGVPSVVMFTTMVHSRYLEKRYRDAMGVVWEMEASNCLLDLPAYRVVIRLFVAMNDLSRTARYFSRLKECGIAPTYDIYREVVGVYKASGRLAKCREICREAEMSGFKMEIEK